VTTSHVSYAGDDQNQAIRGRFQKFMQFFCKLVVKKLIRGLVHIASLDTFVARVQKWPNLRPTVSTAYLGGVVALTKRTTPGLSDSKLLNSDDHGLNRRSESCVKGPQAIAIEKDVSRGSCFNPWLFEVDAVEGSKRGN